MSEFGHTWIGPCSECTMVSHVLQPIGERLVCPECLPKMQPSDPNEESDYIHQVDKKIAKWIGCIVAALICLGGIVYLLRG